MLLEPLGNRSGLRLQASSVGRHQRPPAPSDHKYPPAWVSNRWRKRSPKRSDLGKAKWYLKFKVATHHQSSPRPGLRLLWSSPPSSPHG